MALLSQKVLDNRRRQHALVTAHKRRIRDEVLACTYADEESLV